MVKMVTHMLSAKYQTPYMVENHSCCKAFIHMMAARVSVRPNRKMPNAENFRILWVHSAAPVSSCFSDQYRSLYESSHHTKKQTAAEM